MYVFSTASVFNEVGRWGWGGKNNRVAVIDKLLNFEIKYLSVTESQK